MRTPDEIMEEKGYNANSLREMMEEVRNWASVFRQEMIDQLETIIYMQTLPADERDKNDEDFEMDMLRGLQSENERLQAFETFMDEMIGIWINNPKYSLTREHDKQYDDKGYFGNE